MSKNPHIPKKKKRTIITRLDKSLSADLPSSKEQSLQIKWAQGEETFPMSYDRSSTCVTALISGGVSNTQGKWQTRRKCKTQA